jgi:hypothetical protein
VDNKRVHSRFTLWLPVRVDARSGRMEAVCRDASSGGVLIAGSADLKVGDRVTITFRLSDDDDKEGFILGKIVRVEEQLADGTRRMAVEFVKPVPELEALFRRASSRPPPPTPRS